MKTRQSLELFTQFIIGDSYICTSTCQNLNKYHSMLGFPNASQ